MKKFILATVATIAVASLFACSADVPAEADPQATGPTGSAIKYDANSVTKTKVVTKSSSSKAKSSSSEATSSSSSSSLDFSDICDSYSEIDMNDPQVFEYLGISEYDLDGDGTYYYCNDDEEYYCNDGKKFTTDCNSDVIEALEKADILD